MTTKLDTQIKWCLNKAYK